MQLVQRSLAICFVFLDVAVSWQSRPEAPTAHSLAEPESDIAALTQLLSPRPKRKVRPAILTQLVEERPPARRHPHPRFPEARPGVTGRLQEVQEQRDDPDVTDDHILRTNCDRLLFAPMCGVFIIFVFFLAWEIKHLRDLSEKKAGMSTVDGSQAVGDASQPALELEPEEKVWSYGGLVALTSFRFYTGYLSATWLPYLLAREGEDLWTENQSLFMGSAKLIYGMTILLNPVFGRLGDQVAALSHGSGRRLFLRMGICVAAVGIFVSLISARLNYFWPFMGGITLWRLGEALNDVTTEALVPELVPQEQWQAGSSVKSLQFLVGGLFGYIVLLFMPANVQYSWLYYSYLIGMFLLVLPPLMLLKMDTPRTITTRASQTFVQSMADSYLTPANYSGGFPLACLAVFIFSLGTAPIFFLLLIVRDLVKIEGVEGQQRYFSLASLVFFLSAAISAVFAGGKLPETDQSARLAAKRHRLNMLLVSMFTFGVACSLTPLVGWLPSMQSRLVFFFGLALLFGLAFGSAFTRFQDCTWSILPEGVDMANAMGFNVMSRLFGVGLGNFISGVILDCFYVEISIGVGNYSRPGYLCMCTYSAVCIFLSCFVASKSLDSSEESPSISSMVGDEKHYSN